MRGCAHKTRAQAGNNSSAAAACVLAAQDLHARARPAPLVLHSKANARRVYLVVGLRNGFRRHRVLFHLRRQVQRCSTNQVRMEVLVGVVVVKSAPGRTRVNRRRGTNSRLAALSTPSTGYSPLWAGVLLRMPVHSPGKINNGSADDALADRHTLCSSEACPMPVSTIDE